MSVTDDCINDVMELHCVCVHVIINYDSVRYMNIHDCISVSDDIVYMRGKQKMHD